MINIEESEKFNEISSYLESLKEKFDEYEKKLLEIKSKIGYDPTGEINEAYEKAASKVKEKVSNLKNGVTVIPQTAGTIIKSSTAALNYTLPSGETIEITYGMLQDCIDSKTGEITLENDDTIVKKDDF